MTSGVALAVLPTAYFSTLTCTYRKTKERQTKEIKTNDQKNSHKHKQIFLKKAGRQAGRRKEGKKERKRRKKRKERKKRAGKGESTHLPDDDCSGLTDACGLTDMRYT